MSASTASPAIIIQIDFNQFARVLSSSYLILLVKHLSFLTRLAKSVNKTL